jgi:hypothetical protein
MGDILYHIKPKKAEPEYQKIKIQQLVIILFLINYPICVVPCCFSCCVL